MHTKLQQAACTSYSNGLMPSTSSPWSQNANQKRLMTGVPEKIRRFHSYISGTQLSNLSSSSLAPSDLNVRQICSVCGLPDQANPTVLQFGPHQLRKMCASLYSRHGQSKHNQPRSCHGVYEWQLNCSQNQQSVLLHGQHNDLLNPPRSSHAGWSWASVHD